MRICKFLTVILALGLSVAAAGADFKLPECDAMAAWAAGFPAEKRNQVTAKVNFSELLRNDSLVPLFGWSLLDWGPPQFHDADARLDECAKTVDEHQEQAERDGIQGLRRELMAAKTPVRRIGQARDKVADSVEVLLAELTAPRQLGILDQALDALRGMDVRHALSTVPMELRRSIGNIVHQYPYLLSSDAKALSAGLLVRRDELEEQRREAELTALQALENARAELDAAGVSAEGLVVLDRLQRHPALGRVQPNDARAFIDELNTKREQVRAELMWLRQQGAEADLASAKAELEALPLAAASLAVLDRLARLPALRELPANSVQDFLGQLDHKRRAILDAEERRRLHRISQALAAIHQELAALPLSTEGLAAVDRLGHHTVLSEVSQYQAHAFYRELQAKRDEITEALRRQRETEEARIADQALASLGQAEGGKLENLGAYRQSAAQTARSMESEVGKMAAQRFWRGFNKRFAEEAEVMLPQFREALQAIPGDQDGLQRLRTAAVDLSGVEDSRSLPGSYNQAVEARVAEMAAQRQKQVCEKRWKAMGLDSEDAEQALWGAGSPTTLGDFLCTLMDGGHQVHGYQSPGWFSDTHTLTLTLKSGDHQTLLLHQGEVRPGQEMLIGYQVKDAKQERPLNVQAWEKLVADLAAKQIQGNRSEALP